MKNFLRLKDFFIQNKWRYIFGIFWLICVDTLQILVPKILGIYTDGINSNTISGTDLITYSFYILLIASLIYIFRYFWRMYIMGSARLLEYKLRNDLYSHYQKLSTNYYNNNKIGNLMAHATNDIRAIRMAAGLGVLMVFDISAILISSIIIMATTISLKLTIIALLPIPFLILISNKFGGLIHKRFRKSQESFSHLTEAVQENISGIRVIKAFVRENNEKIKFNKANEDYVDKNMQLIKVQSIFSPIVRFISGLSFLIVLAFGGYLVINREISIGDFVAFNSYIGLLTGPIISIGWIINVLQRGSASMARLNAIFDIQPEIYDEPDIVDNRLNSIKGDIELKNLNFSYPNSNTKVLNHINLIIPSGNTIAIVGKTGSGKSTLVNLLIRLFNADDNMIKINNLDINKYPLKVLQEQVGFVPQDNFLFSSTITENIAFGISSYTNEDIENAAENAYILNDILDFSDGFNTVVGERGITLSGGQKQRISLARAIIKDPEILILDDCLSAVDTKTEDAILNRLTKLRTNKTTIIISHRISTIKSAENIVLLDKGKIIESGKHEDLLNKHGLYYELHKKQLLEEMIASE